MTSPDLGAARRLAEQIVERNAACGGRWVSGLGPQATKLAEVVLAAIELREADDLLAGAPLALRDWSRLSAARSTFDSACAGAEGKT